MGTTVFLISTSKILRIEDCSKVVITEYSEDITAMDLIINCYDLISLVICSKKLQVLNYSSKKIVFEMESQYNIDQVISVNDSTLVVYSQERSLISTYNFRDKSLLYTLIFNSKVPKLISFCEETEQLIILNKNSCKMMILSLDDKANVSKYIIFGLNNQVKDFKHTVLENTIKNQPVYEGNSKHQIYVFHEDSVDLYSLEVISTKTMGFRYGPEPEPLNLQDDNSSAEELSRVAARNIDPVVEIPYIDQEIKQIIESGVPASRKFAGRHEESKSASTPVVFKKVGALVPQQEQRISPPRPRIHPDEALSNLPEIISKLVSQDHISSVIYNSAQQMKKTLIETIETSAAEALKNVLSEPVREISSLKISPISQSLTAGLEQFSSMQLELHSLLSSISMQLGLALPEPKNESLAELVKKKDLVKIQKKLRTVTVQEIMDEEQPQDYWFELGYSIIEIGESGDIMGINALEAICYRLAPESQRFGEFYFRITKNNVGAFTKSIEILESKF